MKRLLKRSFFVLTLFIFSYGLAHAVGGTGIWASTQCAADSVTGGPIVNCDFCDGIIVADNIIKILFDASIIIGGVMIVIGGITMMISGGNETTFKKGKNIIVKSVTGVVIALLSWVAVGTLLRVLTGNANFAWYQVSCKHNPQLPAINIAAGPSTGLFAAIANNGIFACGTTTQSITGVPARAQTYPLGIMPFLSKDYCGKNAADTLNQYPLSWKTDWTFAKLSANGGYSCSASGESCNDISDQTISPDDSCLLIHKSQCTNANAALPIYAKLANNGVWACGNASDCSDVQGAPTGGACYNASSTSIIMGPSSYLNANGSFIQCNAKISFNSDLFSFAKVVNGVYACSPSNSDCSDIPNASLNSACLVIPKGYCGAQQ